MAGCTAKDIENGGNISKYNSVLILLKIISQIYQFHEEFIKNLSLVQLPLQLPLLLETVWNFLERFLILIPGVQLLHR